jgi:hypothetical protein
LHGCIRQVRFHPKPIGSTPRCSIACNCSHSLSRLSAESPMAIKEIFDTPHPRAIFYKMLRPGTPHNPPMPRLPFVTPVHESNMSIVCVSSQNRAGAIQRESTGPTHSTHLRCLHVSTASCSPPVKRSPRLMLSQSSSIVAFCAVPGKLQTRTPRKTTRR